MCFEPFFDGVPLAETESRARITGRTQSSNQVRNWMALRAMVCSVPRVTLLGAETLIARCRGWHGSAQSPSLFGTEGDIARHRDPHCSPPRVLLLAAEGLSARRRGSQCSATQTKPSTIGTPWLGTERGMASPPAR